METLQNFVESAHPLWQWLAVMLVSGIPFVESYFGSVLGIIAGVIPSVAIIAAIVGNWISMVLFVTFGQKLNFWRKKDGEEPSRKQRKFGAMFNKYGIAGVSLIGQTFLPSQITSMGMVTFGAPKNKVIFWQTISIILWGAVFGLLAVAGINALAMQ